MSIYFTYATVQNSMSRENWMEGHASTCMLKDTVLEGLKVSREGGDQLWRPQEPLAVLPDPFSLSSYLSHLMEARTTLS